MAADIYSHNRRKNWSKETYGRPRRKVGEHTPDGQSRCNTKEEAASDPWDTIPRCRLAQETGDNDIRRSFQIASNLHTNFCEGWDTANGMASGLQDVEDLLNKLEPFT